MKRFIIILGELHDKVPRVYIKTVGEGNADMDTAAVTRDGEPNLLMITKVTIGYFEYNGVKDVRW